MLHGSDSEETARKELEFFFPVEQTVAVIKPDALGTKGKNMIWCLYKRIWDSTIKIGCQLQDSIWFGCKTQNSFTKITDLTNSCTDIMLFFSLGGEGGLTQFLGAHNLFPQNIEISSFGYTLVCFEILVQKEQVLVLPTTRFQNCHKLYDN